MNLRKRNRLLVKGAAEIVTKRCNRVLLGNGNVVKLSNKLNVARGEDKIYAAGTSALALAYKSGNELPGKMGKVSSADGVNQLPELRPVSAGGMEYATIEKDMVLCGVVGIQDPARPEVKDSINSCKEAGIRVMMITGDSKDTAVAIVRDTGIFGEYEDTNIDSSVFTGKEFFCPVIREAAGGSEAWE